MKIVSITESGKRKKVFTLSTDHEEEVRVDGGFISDHSIREGTEVEDGLWETWLREWRQRRAMDAALTYLGYRGRTRSQMEAYLRGKDFPIDTVEYAVGKLTGYGYLDDRRYAKEYMEGKLRDRPMGRMRIRMALKERGIRDGIIEEVLAGYEEEEELNQAAACLKKQINLRRGKSPEIRKKQCYAALARRGFNWETIQRAWTTVEKEEEAGT
jgi:regulatory protein